MQTVPVLDALFTALLNRDNSEIESILSQRAAEASMLRVVICSDAPGTIDLEFGLNVLSSNYVVPFFKGPRAFFVSNRISLEAFSTGSNSKVPIDFSLSLDSNVAEKLRALLAGEKIQQIDRDRINEILMLKAQNFTTRFDLYPFLIENARLIREDPLNERPLKTLIAFRMLDHLDWDNFRSNPSRLVFDSPRDGLEVSLRAEVESYLSRWVVSDEIDHHEAKSAGTRALLLRLAQLWPEKGNPDSKTILSELLYFSIHKLNSIPIFELKLIWSGITSSPSDPFFGPIAGKSKKVLEKVRGMAWDMTLLRRLEIHARNSIDGSFFIPYFVSFDSRWRNLLSLNAVTLAVINDATKSALFARANELEFQHALNLSLSSDLKSEMTPEKIEARRRNAQSIQSRAMLEIVAEEETKLLH